MKKGEDHQIRLLWETRAELTLHSDRALELGAKSGHKPPGRDRIKMGSLVVYDNVGIYAGAAFYLSFDFLVIDSVWVEPERQKQGIGRRLIERITDIARESDCRRLITSTLSFHTSFEFWLKQGFKEYARLEDSPRGGATIYLKKEIFSNEDK